LVPKTAIPAGAFERRRQPGFALAHRLARLSRLDQIGGLPGKQVKETQFGFVKPMSASAPMGVKHPKRPTAARHERRRLGRAIAGRDVHPARLVGLLVEIDEGAFAVSERDAAGGLAVRIDPVEMIGHLASKAVGDE
jgi:hypothetical protein